MSSVGANGTRDTAVSYNAPNRECNKATMRKNSVTPCRRIVPLSASTISIIFLSHAESEFIGGYIDMDCRRRGAISRLHGHYHFILNATLSLNSPLARSGLVESFVMARKLIQRIRSPITLMDIDTVVDDRSQANLNINADVRTGVAMNVWKINMHSLLSPWPSLLSPLLPSHSKLQIAQLEDSREFGNDDRFYRTQNNSHLYKIEV